MAGLAKKHPIKFYLGNIHKRSIKPVAYATRRRFCRLQDDLPLECVVNEEVNAIAHRLGWPQTAIVLEGKGPSNNKINFTTLPGSIPIWGWSLWKSILLVHHPPPISIVSAQALWERGVKFGVTATVMLW